ncbi:DMT family transporter [Brevibacillus fluminis]|uniref:DMT family transporter n=1 Tax=Brevibacillus fluminis TaxID=511487 RepID=UPI003F8B3298
MARSAYLHLVLLSLIWGASFFFIKVLLGPFHPWTVVMLRSGFGILIIFVIMLVKGEFRNVKRLPWIPLIIVGCLNNAIPWGLIALSETRLPSSMASVLNATTPLWTMLVGLLVFKGKSSRNQWIGMAIGFIGLLILLDLNPISIISVDLFGFFGMMGATLCYGISSHLAKKYLAHLSSFQVSFFTLLSCMLVAGLVAMTTEEIHWGAVFQPDVMLALGGLGIFGSGVAYIIFYYLIQKAGAQFTSMVTYLVPVTAILWGYALLDEAIHWNLLFGLICILGGVFFAGRPEKKAKLQNVALSEQP